MTLSVQLNHPGNEKPFIIGDGYLNFEDKIIREWNNDIKIPTGPSKKNKYPHYRKLLVNPGEYINNSISEPERDKLMFWGEWEGNSFFTKTGNGTNSPTGLHEPFHSIKNKGCQNTDPYVFGDSYKYAICSQTGAMCNLLDGSLILFGSTTKEGFLLDTVFVVKDHEPAISVFGNKAKNYSNTYREETLDRLGSCYLGSDPSPKKKIYHGQTWYDSKDYFSFVPCKIADKSNSYERALINFPWLSTQKMGHPYNHLKNRSPIDIWNDIKNYVLKNGFNLGIRFDEPPTSDILLPENSKHSDKTVSCAALNEGKPTCY